MNKHTPGPWIVDEHNDIGAMGRHVATPSLYGDGSDDANARLIAAAPDLLAACESALSIMEQKNKVNVPPFAKYITVEFAADDVAVLRAAIAKARGKG